MLTEMATGRATGSSSANTCLYIYIHGYIHIHCLYTICLSLKTKVMPTTGPGSHTIMVYNSVRTCGDVHYYGITLTENICNKELVSNIH